MRVLENTEPGKSLERLWMRVTGFVEQTSGLLDTQVLPGKDESFQFLPELWNLEPGKSLPQVSGIAHQHDSLLGMATPCQNKIAAPCEEESLLSSRQPVQLVLAHPAKTPGLNPDPNVWRMDLLSDEEAEGSIHQLEAAGKYLLDEGNSVTSI
jgi:hypothetical protein